MVAPYIPPPTPSGMLPKRRKPMALAALIGLVALCGVAGAALALLTLRSESEEPTEETQVQPAQIEARPLAEDESPSQGIDFANFDFEADLSTVRVSINTVPPGAEVFRVGASIGQTPFTKEYPQSEEAEQWQFFLDGYEVSEIEVSLSSDFHSEIVLEKVEPEVRTPPPTRAAKPTTPSRGSAPATSTRTTRRPPREEKAKPESERTVITETTGAMLPD